MATPSAGLNRGKGVFSPARGRGPLCLPPQDPVKPEYQLGSQFPELTPQNPKASSLELSGIPGIESDESRAESTNRGVHRAFPSVQSPPFYFSRRVFLRSFSAGTAGMWARCRAGARVFRSAFFCGGNSRERKTTMTRIGGGAAARAGAGLVAGRRENDRKIEKIGGKLRFAAFCCRI